MPGRMCVLLDYQGSRRVLGACANGEGRRSCRSRRHHDGRRHSRREQELSEMRPRFGVCA